MIQAFTGIPYTPPVQNLRSLPVEIFPWSFGLSLQDPNLTNSIESSVQKRRKLL
jgi:hypothetical protein